MFAISALLLSVKTLGVVLWQLPGVSKQQRLMDCLSFLDFIQDGYVQGKK